MVTLCLQMRGAPKINRIRRGFNTVTWKGYDDTGEISVFGLINLIEQRVINRETILCIWKGC